MIRLGPQQEKEIEKAISFLVSAVEKSGNNEKPVILHSLRVGSYLGKLGYGKGIIIAGILHDLLEDSETTFEEIEKEFGRKIANLVQANSFDKNVINKKKRYRQTFTRCMKAGKDALVIKATDILDNSHYYHLAQGEKLRQWLLEKMNHFITNTEGILRKEPVWQELKKQYKKVKSSL